uniref:Putative peritrophin n=1 Tax=Lutzomyia longipalpis TaxID=7200 RepID=A8CW65_LUTLO|nr:putative peritrophin [Lutzomyia longipalpis]
MKFVAVLLIAVEVLGVFGQNDLCLNNRGTSFHPHPDTCKGYYFCTEGEAFENFCQDGFHYSVEEETCVAADTVPCYNGVRLCDVEHVDTAVKDPENCDKYFNCKRGDLAEHATCSEGHSFNPESLTCDASSYGHCHNEQHNYCFQYSDNGQRDFFFAPDPHSCSRYYFCYNGKQQEFKCPEGYYFDHFKNYCTKPYESGCKATPKCPEKGFHVQAHPADCNKYVLCVDGQFYVNSCGPYFFFDYLTSECRHENDATCFV